MDWLVTFIDVLLHLDQHLGPFIEYFGVWAYLILFVIVFCETGLVVTPILPGDSLLFGVGAVAAMGVLRLELLLITLIVAAVSGDAVNYMVGRFVGPRIFHQEQGRFLRKDYLEKTRLFYERHGGKTIIIARFIPIIRTFAPFVAGIGRMRYLRFASYNVIGAVIWVFLFVMAGYYFGNFPAVKENFTLVILAIIIISLMPGIIEFIRHRQQEPVK
jgi:membrane-associated protein